MKTLGIIFSNIHDKALPEMTRWRTIASVPIAARYRLVDFVLSGMANSGITQLGIITKTKYNSLMKHVGSGKDWDLDRKQGGVTIISPYVEAGSGPLYENRLEAMQNAIGYIQASDADNVLLADCDLLANIPYADVIKQHEESGADVTVCYTHLEFAKPVRRDAVGYEIDEDGKVENVKLLRECVGDVNFSLNITVLSRTYLLQILNESVTYGFRSFSRDVMPRQVQRSLVKGYRFDGYVRSISSLNAYFEANMDVLNPAVRSELFDKQDYPIYTRVKDSAPTKYGERAVVKNSLISDGCVINGMVENSILFRGVRVDEGAIVSNCIVLNDAIIESNVSMDYITTDKRVIVRRGTTISGCDGHPFFVGRDEVL